MRQSIASVFVLLAVNIIGCHAEPTIREHEGPFTFRNTSWGMSVQQVIDAERRSPVTWSDESAWYYDNVAGLPCQVIYDFVDSLLVGGCYKVTQPRTGATEYFRDYLHFYRLLEQKYGEPFAKDSSWRESPSTVPVSLGSEATYALFRDSQSTVELTLLNHGDERVIVRYETRDPELQQKCEAKTRAILEDLKFFRALQDSIDRLEL